MEVEFNRKIADLIISMSDVAVYVVDVKQFATTAKLKEVIEESNELIRRAVYFFNKHKGRGIFSEYSPIDSVCWFTYLKTRFREGFLCISRKGAGRARKAANRL